MIMDQLAEHEVVYSAIKSSEKRTNYERIKNMSYDELAHILFSSCTEHINCEFKLETCKQCVLNWLNSESEV